MKKQFYKLPRERQMKSKMSYKKLHQIGYAPTYHNQTKRALQQGFKTFFNPVKSPVKMGGKSGRFNAHVSKYKYGSINKASYIQT